MHLTEYAGDRRLAARELFYREDHTATVNVFVSAAGDKFVAVDGHFIGSTERESDKKQRLLAHLPLLLCPQPRRAITIGLGSGITLGAMAQHPGLQKLFAVEIVPSMATAARFFNEENANVLADPRVHLRIGDGLHFLKTTALRFDAIISDAKLNPEYTGNALVYTREYYQWSRDRLSDGGIFVQWVPLYLPREILRTVIRTFCSVFPAADLWFFPQQHLLLMGRRNAGPFDFRRLQQRMEELVPLQRFQLHHPYVLASSWIAGREALQRFAGKGDWNTYDRPRIEFEAVRLFRKAPRGVVESDNLQALTSLMQPISQGFVHAAADSLRHFRESFLHVVHGLTEARRAGSLAAGRADFEAALALNPAEGRARDLLRQAAREAGAGSRTAAQGSPGALLTAAQWQLQNGKLQQAQQTVLRLLAARPDDPQALNLLGRIYLKNGEVQEAAKVLQRAAEKASQNADILLNLATAREQMGALDEALNLLQRAQELEPRSAKIYNNTGIVLSRMGRLDAAVEAFRRATALDPLFADAFSNLGIALARKGRLQDARTAYEKALEIRPQHRAARKNLALVLLQMEDFPRAAQLLEAVVAAAPRDADAWVNLGLAYVRSGRPQKARSCWEQALAIDPNLPEARKNLELLKQMGY